MLVSFPQPINQDVLAPVYKGREGEQYSMHPLLGSARDLELGQRTSIILPDYVYSHSR